MSLEGLTESVRSRVGDDSGLNATLKFSFEDQGVIFIDGKSSPNTVSNDDKPADCTIVVSMEDFQQIVSGTLNPTSAFMAGKLKVEGNMGIAMKIGDVLK